MRRGGIGAIQAQRAREEAMKATGEKVNAELLDAMRKQLRLFQENLEIFARDHGKEIQDNPEFRAKFHQMCANVGVDPLTSSKDMWSSLGIGEFYFELAVRTIEVCVATRKLNGGIIEVNELLKRLQRKRITFTEDITVDDVDKAVKKLAMLGKSFALMKLGQKYVVRSVPVELGMDHGIVLKTVELTGRGTRGEMLERSKLDEARLDKALKFLMEKEMVWVDDQTKPRVYWFLGLVKGAGA